MLRVADVWVEIYSGIARFPFDSMAFVMVHAGSSDGRSTIIINNGDPGTLPH